MACANLRVGALIARGPAMARLRAGHMVDTMFVPAALQHTAREVVGSAAWRRHTHHLRSSLHERLVAAITALSAALGPESLELRPTGGYHLWVRLPGELDSAAVAAAALRRGVAVSPGAIFGAGDAAASHLRISYVAAASVADLTRGIDQVAALAGG